MKTLIICIAFLLYTSLAVGQNSLCITSPGKGQGIAYNAVEVNNYLQLNRYKIIFFGEQHNDHFDPEIKYNLIKDLNKQNGVRHFFMEMGHSAAWLFNQYLLTGNSLYLSYNKSYFFAGNYPRFWQQLYEYNSALPDSLKIVLHGLDFERTELFKVLELLAEKQSVPAPLRSVMDTIAAHLNDATLKMFLFSNERMIGNANNSAFIKTLRYIQTALRKYPAEASQLFGENYVAAEKIINNNGSVTVHPKPRNRTMQEEMIKTIEEYKIRKFAVFVGAAHADYSTASSLPNKLLKTAGFTAADILNISELAYNVTTRNGMLVKIKTDSNLRAINKNCSATILPAAQLPQYSKTADFIIISNNEQ